MARHATRRKHPPRRRVQRQCCGAVAGASGPAPPPTAQTGRMTLPMNGTSRIASFPRASYSAAWKPRGGSQDCLRKCAAGAVAQAPLGLNAGGTTACMARRVERSGSAIGTPFGAVVHTPDALHTTLATLITRRCGADQVFPVKGARNLRRHRPGDGCQRPLQGGKARLEQRSIRAARGPDQLPRPDRPHATASRRERAPAAQRAATTAPVHHHLDRCATRVARGTAAAAGCGKHEPPRLRLRRGRLPDPQTAPASTTSRSR